MQQCEHINTNFEEFATGLSPAYEPLMVVEEVCLSCGDVVERGDA